MMNKSYKEPCFCWSQS